MPMRTETTQAEELRRWCTRVRSAEPGALLVVPVRASPGSLRAGLGHRVPDCRGLAAVAFVGTALAMGGLAIGLLLASNDWTRLLGRTDRTKEQAPHAPNLPAMVRHGRPRGNYRGRSPGSRHGARTGDPVPFRLRHPGEDRLRAAASPSRTNTTWAGWASIAGTATSRPAIPHSPGCRPPRPA